MEEVLEKKMWCFRIWKINWKCLVCLLASMAFSCMLRKSSFAGAFTLKGRFDSGKTRAHFVLIPLPNEGHWSH
jgi:hypothetical protein